MTELELRQKIVSTAISYIGCKESDGSHRKIIDLYNSHTPRARGYKVTYTDAWCATFVSAVAIKCGLTDIMPTECSCSRMIQLYKNIGRWMESDSYVPQPGDLIMYDWNDSGKGDDTGAPEHVGIVVSVVGDSFKVIEGNYSNAVKYRPMNVNGRYIRGYCVPDYAGKADEDAPAAVNTKQWTSKDQQGRILDIALQVDHGSVWYQVHTLNGKWLPKVTGFDKADYINGYAGNHKPIDAIRVYYTTPAGETHKQARYAVKTARSNGWLPEQVDDSTKNGMDGYAGNFGEAITDFKIRVDNK